jgi:endonuclease YncB( thermonuclease family)
MRAIQAVQTAARSSRQARRVLLGLLLACSVAAVSVPPASAQGASCAQVTRGTLLVPVTNVDLQVRDARGLTCTVRLAGLQPWPFLWPQESELFERIEAVTRASTLELRPAAVERALDGTLLREVWLPSGRGTLAEALVRQGWAEVAGNVDQVVPDQAAALRTAEAEARQATRGLWAVRDRLVSYITPGGRSLVVDRRLVPSVDVLVRTDIGRPLVETMARAGIPLFMAPQPGNSWAFYVPAARVIWVHPSLEGADPRTIATVVAHEAVHAKDHYEGRLREEISTDLDEANCFASEVEAFTVGFGLYRQFFGDEGAPLENHRLERSSNIFLELFGGNPEDIADAIRRVYRQQCRPRIG